MAKVVKQQTSLWQNTRFLGAAIAIAAAALVVSGVVLMMLNSPGDFSTVRPITKLTSTGSAPVMATPPPAPITAPETSATSAISTPETSAAEITASKPPRASVPSSPGTPLHPTPGQTPRNSPASR